MTKLAGLVLAAFLASTAPGMCQDSGAGGASGGGGGGGGSGGGGGGGSGGASDATPVNQPSQNRAYAAIRQNPWRCEGVGNDWLTACAPSAGIILAKPTRHGYVD